MELPDKMKFEHVIVLPIPTDRNLQRMMDVIQKYPSLKGEIPLETQVHLFARFCLVYRTHPFMAPPSMLGCVLKHYDLQAGEEDLEEMNPSLFTLFRSL